MGESNAVSPQRGAGSWLIKGFIKNTATVTLPLESLSHQVRDTALRRQRMQWWGDVEIRGHNRNATAQAGLPGPGVSARQTLSARSHLLHRLNFPLARGEGPVNRQRGRESSRRRPRIAAETPPPPCLYTDPRATLAGAPRYTRRGPNGPQRPGLKTWSRQPRPRRGALRTQAYSLCILAGRILNDFRVTYRRLKHHSTKSERLRGSHLAGDGQERRAERRAQPLDPHATSKALRNEGKASPGRGTELWDRAVEQSCGTPDDE
ncbi:hypothetical protein SKAU_G00084990 [Synaphobranchus kaupii]|uniref:Uncharacterized protein n=1 Tax=Synaphobranchus kaupii TaxID=118154 RepID=A0A9Q1FVJ6_SYNKA|nr:hypothetical protein SKAU_G00084990 [Synaphobranchus kaupii]